MAFSPAAVRTEYHRLLAENGRHRINRIPTREDIHARWHWQTEARLLARGRDPGTYCGRNSPMISGRGREVVRSYAPPGPSHPPASSASRPRSQLKRKPSRMTGAQHLVPAGVGPDPGVGEADAPGPGQAGPAAR